MKVTDYVFIPKHTNVIQDNQIQSIPQFEPEFMKKSKTELCRYWTQGQVCKFGEKCTFAHGEDELQKKTHVT